MKHNHTSLTVYLYIIMWSTCTIHHGIIIMHIYITVRTYTCMYVCSTYAISQGMHTTDILYCSTPLYYTWDRQVSCACMWISTYYSIISYLPSGISLLWRDNVPVPNLWPQDVIRSCQVNAHLTNILCDKNLLILVEKLQSPTWWSLDVSSWSSEIIL